MDLIQILLDQLMELTLIMTAAGYSKKILLKITYKKETDHMGSILVGG